MDRTAACRMDRSQAPAPLNKWRFGYHVHQSLNWFLWQAQNIWCDWNVKWYVADKKQKNKIKVEKYFIVGSLSNGFGLTRSPRQTQEQSNNFSRQLTNCSNLVLNNSSIKSVRFWCLCHCGALTKGWVVWNQTAPNFKIIPQKKVHKLPNFVQF